MFGQVSKDVISERKIDIGEKLIFIDTYLDERNKNKHYAWMVKFRSDDGYEGEAAFFYFAIEEEWMGLKEYFYRSLH